MNWLGWPVERILILFTGIAFLMIFVQVTMFHYRQNFRHWSMWIPVLGTPVFGMVSIIYGFYNGIWLAQLLAILFVVGFVAGGFGSFMHVRGVGQRVGGFELRNFLIGPPLTLPGMVSAISVLGLIALYWR
ncbi:hypothetical protein LLE49_21950 [Alicyclobacillus tolerans]|uniref:hypothetical protein n=1 Tax=Alicyclobacillus tolerans TaxID=90970 RepID=UPI001F43D6F4|nr:hypothetical protein [Alicyclobacillus tolerans]MCF8567389.1 hypothetical protein [Alicyclobacillus tolerans]